MNTKTLRCFVLLVVCLAALFPSMLLAGTPVTAPPPEALAAPADQVCIRVLAAKGVQIYECRAIPGELGKYAWVFKAPEATLFDEEGRRVGRHYAGPTWEVTNSKVIGKVLAKADAPDGKGIPWLLLKVVGSSGSGPLTETLSIQRVATIGGQAPTEPADAAHVGQERRVDYTATYFFYVAKP